MTTKQQQQFNRMAAALRRIAKGYVKPGKDARKKAKVIGLDYEEFLEMSYENIQTEAASALTGVKIINIASEEEKAVQQFAEKFESMAIKPTNQ